MNREVDCNIVNDLLPNYFGGSISKETKDIIDDHINNCNECKISYQIIKDNNLKGINKESDFLKTVKNVIKLIICICMFLVVVSYIWISFGDESAKLSLIVLDGLVLILVMCIKIIPLLLISPCIAIAINIKSSYLKILLITISVVIGYYYYFQYI